MQGFFSNSKLSRPRQVFLSIPKCGICGLHKQGPKIEPFGEGQKKILIVFSTPSEKEPYINENEYKFKKLLKTFGINVVTDCVTTYACICKANKNDYSLTDTQIESCRANIFKLITEYKPKVVLLLGLPAIKSVIGITWGSVDSIKTWIGWKIPDRKYNTWFCPMYSVEYIAEKQDETLNLIFKRHLKQALECETYPWEKIVDYQKKVKLLYNPWEIADYIRELRKEKEMCAFDYETNALKPEYPKSKIASVSISNGKITIAFPYSKEIKKPFKEFLTDPDIMKIASNLKFEDRWSRYKLHTEVANWGWDTMIAAHVIDSRPDITGLKFQTYINFGVEDYSVIVDKMLHTGKELYNNVFDIDIRDLLLYNGLDSLFEYKLAKKQMKILGNRK